MLTIAIPKGSMFNECLDLFEQIGIFVDNREDIKRKLTLYDRDGRYKFIIVRPMDVPVYVEHGAADIGVVGKDTLAETGCSVAELVDLKFGYCRLVIAALKSDGLTVKKLTPDMRVATKFYHCAEEYFRSIDLNVDLIKLYGSIELAPIVGLADVIIDLVATGQTLKENGLEVIETLFESTARFVSNKVSLKSSYNEIIQMAEALQNVVLRNGAS